MNEDERLKQTFDELRAEDERRVPSFESVQKKRRPKVSFLVVAIPIVTAAAALLLFVRTLERPMAGAVSAAAPPARESGGEHAVAAAAPPPAAPPMPSGQEAPLDFLLEVSLFHGTPDFDTSFLKGSVR